MKSSFLAALFCTCMLGSPSFLLAQEESRVPGDRAEDATSVVSRDIDALRKSRTGDGLKSIALKIERGIEEKQPSVQVGIGAWKKERRSVLEMWVKAIDAVSQKIDPAFNPDDAPSMNVPVPTSPPSESAKADAPPTGYAAGMSPEDIKDPKVRERYEQAMRENSEKVSRHKLQRALLELDRQWSSKAGIFARRTYSSRPDDISEIDRILNSLVHSQAKRTKLRRELVDMP